MIHRSERERGEPRRRENRGHCQQGALAERELAHLPRAGAPRAEDRRLEAPALGQEAGQEEQRGPGEHCELDRGDEHARARDEQRAIGALEHAAEAGLHGQAGGRATLGVQRVLQASNPLAERPELVEPDRCGVGLGPPTRLGAVAGELREGLGGDNEGPERREPQLLLPLELESGASPVWVVGRPDPVHTRDADGDRLVLVPDRGDLDGVALLQSERSGGGFGDNRLDLVAGCVCRPITCDQLRVPLQPVECAEDGQSVGRDPFPGRKHVRPGEAAPVNVDRVLAEDPLHRTGHLPIERLVVLVARLAGDRDRRVLHRRVLERPLEPAGRDGLGVDRARRQQRRRQEDGEERCRHHQPVVPRPAQDEAPGSQRERAHGRPREPSGVPPALPPAESRPRSTSMAEPSTAS